MKIKTFRNILVVICIANLIFGIDYEEKLLPLIFNMQEPTLYQIYPLFGSMFRLFAFPVILLCFWPLFKMYGYNKMTKKTYSLLIPIFSFVLIFPFLFYPSRTEITADAITTHNFFGETSNIYLYEDAKKVKVELFINVVGNRFAPPNQYIEFSYEIEFQNGNIYYLTQDDGDIGWEIIEKIDRVVKENNIEKEVTGKNLYSKMFEYDNFYEYLDRRELLDSLINK